jgi:hypothetical protein
VPKQLALWRSAFIPFLVGVAHRAKHFSEALKYIASRREVWLATGSEILDAYKRQVP